MPLIEEYEKTLYIAGNTANTGTLSSNLSLNGTNCYTGVNQTCLIPKVRFINAAFGNITAYNNIIFYTSNGTSLVKNGTEEVVNNLNNTFGFSIPLTNCSANSYLITPTDPGTHVVDFANSFCSTSIPNGSLQTNNQYYHFSATLIEEATSGGGSDTPPTSDLSGVVSAIFMIPATMICICFFFVIYRIFMRLK